VEDKTLHSYDLEGVGPSFSMFSRPFNQPLKIEHKEFIFRGYKNKFTHTCLMLRLTDVLCWICSAQTFYGKQLHIAAYLHLLSS